MHKLLQNPTYPVTKISLSDLMRVNPPSSPMANFYPPYNSGGVARSSPHMSGVPVWLSGQGTHMSAGSGMPTLPPSLLPPPPLHISAEPPNMRTELLKPAQLLERLMRSPPAVSSRVVDPTPAPTRAVDWVVSTPITLADLDRVERRILLSSADQPLPTFHRNERHSSDQAADRVIKMLAGGCDEYGADRLMSAPQHRMRQFIRSKGAAIGPPRTEIKDGGTQEGAKLSPSSTDDQSKVDSQATLRPSSSARLLHITYTRDTLLRLSESPLALLHPADWVLCVSDGDEQATTDLLPPAARFDRQRYDQCVRRVRAHSIVAAVQQRAHEAHGRSAAANGIPKSTRV